MVSIIYIGTLPSDSVLKNINKIFAPLSGRFDFLRAKKKIFEHRIFFEWGVVLKKKCADTLISMDSGVDICTHALYARVVHNIINYNLFHPSISTEHYVADGII